MGGVNMPELESAQQHSSHDAFRNLLPKHLAGERRFSATLPQKPHP